MGLNIFTVIKLEQGDAAGGYPCKAYLHTD